MILVSNQTEAELHRIAKLRVPHEAVGLILPGERVVEVPNHSETPETNFVATRADMVTHLTSDMDLEEVALWHSHPGGGVGPSRTDMRSKTPFRHHLVVSIVNEDLVLSWY